MKALTRLFGLSMLLVAGARGAHAAEPSGTAHETKETSAPTVRVLPRLREFLVSETLRWSESPVVHRIPLGAADQRRMPELYVPSRLHWTFDGGLELGLGVPSHLRGMHNGYAVFLGCKKKF